MGGPPWQVIVCNYVAYSISNQVTVQYKPGQQNEECI